MTRKIYKNCLLGIGTLALVMSSQACNQKKSKKSSAGVEQEQPNPTAPVDPNLVVPPVVTTPIAPVVPNIQGRVCNSKTHTLNIDLVSMLLSIRGDAGTLNYTLIKPTTWFGPGEGYRIAHQNPGTTANNGSVLKDGKVGTLYVTDKNVNLISVPFLSTKPNKTVSLFGTYVCI